MSHMVIFRSSEGKAGYHQAEGLDEAVRFVERLRNSEQVEKARIFRMEELSFEYRPYFRVEVGGASSGAPAPEAEAAPAVAGFEPPQPVEAEGDEAGSRRGLFSR